MIRSNVNTTKTVIKILAVCGALSGTVNGIGFSVPEKIEKYSNMSEAEQLTNVKQENYLIKYIKNPSEKVQLEAVKKDGFAIQYINTPSEAVQLAALKQNKDAIYYIKNPSKNAALFLKEKL